MPLVWMINSFVIDSSFCICSLVGGVYNLSSLANLSLSLDASLRFIFDILLTTTCLPWRRKLTAPIKAVSACICVASSILRLPLIKPFCLACSIILSKSLLKPSSPKRCLNFTSVVSSGVSSAMLRPAKTLFLGPLHRQIWRL